jgi:hypothetical protein
MFVPNKEFSSVLATAREAVPKHPNFLADAPASAETWFNYRFHLNGDRGRGVRLAVLLLHFPAA